MKALNASLSLALTVAVAGCESGPVAEAQNQEAAAARPTTATAPAAAMNVPSRAEDVTPLKAGASAPALSLRKPDGSAASLGELYAEKPSVLIFYRGGWCPYCNTHLGQIAKAEPELARMGYQVLAISPDRPEELRKSAEKEKLSYTLLSDSEAELAKAFGVAFRVDDETVEKYQGFGIDLDRASGQSHHLLPVPAVYVVDKKGVIRFAHWNPDYKKRLTSEELLDAARGALREGAPEPGDAK